MLCGLKLLCMCRHLNGKKVHLAQHEERSELRQAAGGREAEGTEDTAQSDAAGTQAAGIGDGGPHPVQSHPTCHLHAQHTAVSMFHSSMSLIPHLTALQTAANFVTLMIHGGLRL